MIGNVQITWSFVEEISKSRDVEAIRKVVELVLPAMIDDNRSERHRWT